MMDSRVVYTLLVLILSCIIYKVYQFEVNPEEFSVASCSLRIDANPSALFGFVTQTAVLEKVKHIYLTNLISSSQFAAGKQLLNILMPPINPKLYHSRLILITSLLDCYSELITPLKH